MSLYLYFVQEELMLGIQAGEVVHLKQLHTAKIPWTMGVNTHLPADIAIRWVKQFLMIFMLALQRQDVIAMDFF